jgi:predicted  nucleic acid-binding Zn-ribbon protein
MERLLELQRLDDELIAFEEELGAAPGRRSRIEAGRSGGATRLAEAREALEQAEAQQRQIEATLQDQEALLKKLEGQQFQVKSNDAYTALLHEMEAAKRAISDGETQILEGMEAIESARAALATGEAEVAEILGRLDTEEKTLDERERELVATAARVREARAVVRPDIESKLLEKYEKISARRRPAVVLISNEMCVGCRVGIPPQSYIEILRLERVVTCGNCHRILLPIEKIHAGDAA